MTARTRTVSLVRKKGTDLFLAGRSYVDFKWVTIERARIFDSAGPAKNSMKHLLRSSRWSPNDTNVDEIAEVVTGKVTINVE